MRRLIVLILVVCSSILGFSQTAKPIKWTITASKTTLKQGESFDIILKAEILPEWYLYSSDFDPTLGPSVTSILFDIDDSYQVVKALIPIGAKEKYDSLWEGKVRYFTTTALFKQEVKIIGKNPIIKARLYYQVCNDKIGKCIPYEEKIYFDNFIITENLKIDSINKGNTIDKIKSDPKIIIESSNQDPENPSNNNPVDKENKNELTLEGLEEEKQKLIIVDKNGEDLTIKQLKNFAKKYGAK